MATLINPTKSGLVLAALMGGWHLLWSLLVLFGFAQAVADFIFWIHFIKPVYVIEPFQAAVAVVLVATTSVLGYVVGWLFGTLWNWVHR